MWTNCELLNAGDPESKQLLDAFFLGKALAETVSERIGSLVGELLSEVGQRQAEQQRQIREFQVTWFQDKTLIVLLMQSLTVITNSITETFSEIGYRTRYKKGQRRQQLEQRRKLWPLTLQSREHLLLKSPPSLTTTSQMEPPWRRAPPAPLKVPMASRLSLMTIFLL